MLEYISYLATPLLIISSVPQIIKMYKTKNSEGISLTMFYLTFASVLLLFIEAYRLKSTIIMSADICSMAMLGANIYLIKKYKKHGKDKQNRTT